jgi:hypothetical protein
MSGSGWGADPGLLARFRRAGTQIEWRSAASSGRGRRGRAVEIAHLHDEEAPVARWGSDRAGGIAAGAGPLGALIVLLEVDRRGPPGAWGAWNAGTDARFPEGAIVAAWGEAVPHPDSVPRPGDLIEIARYALA